MSEVHIRGESVRFQWFVNQGIRMFICLLSIFLFPYHAIANAVSADEGNLVCSGHAIESLEDVTVLVHEVSVHIESVHWVQVVRWHFPKTDRIRKFWRKIEFYPESQMITIWSSVFSKFFRFHEAVAFGTQNLKGLSKMGISYDGFDDDFHDFHDFWRCLSSFLPADSQSIRVFWSVQLAAGSTLVVNDESI